MSTSRQISLAAARRIALAAQGFDRPRPAGRVDARHFRRTIRQLGLIQIDYVNVLVPAQYQVPFSRLGIYERERFDELIYHGREFTEQWAHEASIVPMDLWPALEHRRREHRVRPWGSEKFLATHREYVDGVLDEIRERGPLGADALELPEGLPRRVDTHWSRSVSRIVLDAHFGFGQLAVAERRANFSRLYDLSERIIPDEHRMALLSRDDAQRELLRRAARSHGIGTAADLADYYRMPVKEARPLLRELVDAGELESVRVESWREEAFLHPQAPCPRKISAACLLSPFDPLVWFRSRTERLFDFEYRIEIYTPAAKRRWGYYVLPFLLGESLAARVDLKADRGRGRLLVLASHSEDAVDHEQVGLALAKELRLMATWLGLDEINVARKGRLARALKSALCA